MDWGSYWKLPAGRAQAKPPKQEAPRHGLRSAWNLASPDLEGASLGPLPHNNHFAKTASLLAK